METAEPYLAYRVPEPGYLRIQGAGWVDFVQRQTTNDVRLLGPGRSVLTVLTSPTARILDVWQLVPEPDGVGVVTLPGRAGTTARYLQARIFFMDKVTVTNVSDQISQIRLMGAARTALELAGIPRVPAPGELLEADLAGAPLRAIGLALPLSGNALLLCEAGASDRLLDRVATAGAHVLTPAAFDIWRVERGLPGPQGELTEDFTPLEVGLREAVSSSKGCYTGQEVIARQITRDKVTKALAGVCLEGPAAPGDSVQVEGRSVGTITSVVKSPRLGHIALAVLKRPHHEPGPSVTVRHGDASVAGSVVALPFET